MATVNQHPAFANLGKSQSTRELVVGDSKFLSVFKYDPAGMSLTVSMKNGAEYVYYQIPGQTWDQLLLAPNKSKFYADNIRGKNQSQRTVNKNIGSSEEGIHGQRNRSSGKNGRGTKGR